ncbi:MAG: ester cyclase [Bacteroidota bacterium]|nr:ester cyclase [Bacteroidota bacterium]
MKTIFFFSFLFIICFFLSCNNEASTNTGMNKDSATGSTSGSSNRQQAMLEANRQVIKGIETGDSALMQKYISDDAIDHGGGANGQDVKGRDIVSMLTTVHQDVDNLKINIEQEAANDEYVFSLVHMTGTTNKPVWGMPANTKIDSRSVDVLRIKDGKIAEHWGYADPSEIMKMMQTSAPGKQSRSNT